MSNVRFDNEEVQAFREYTYLGVTFYSIAKSTEKLLEGFFIFRKRMHASVKFGGVRFLAKEII